MCETVCACFSNCWASCLDSSINTYVHTRFPSEISRCLSTTQKSGGDVRFGIEFNFFFSNLLKKFKLQHLFMKMFVFIYLFAQRAESFISAHLL